MLGQHPETYGLPQINLLMLDTVEQLNLLLQGPRQFQVHGLLRAVAQLYSGEQTINAVAMARRWISNRFYADSASVYRQLCRRVAPLRLVDPSTTYCAGRERLERLYAAFPEAHFLHLVRHPRSQGEAVIGIGEGALAIQDGSLEFRTKEDVLVDPQYAWYRYNANIRRFFGQLAPWQKYTVQWEAIVSEPGTHLEAICRWLGLEWNEALAAALLHPERSSYAGFGPYSCQLGHDPYFLRHPAFVSRPLPLPSLSGPLSWRDDGQEFLPEVLTLARELGYN